MSGDACPKREQVRACLLGTLSEQETEDMGRHLAACPQCERVIDQIDLETDPLMGALRTEPDRRYLEELGCRRALARAKGIAEGGGTVASDSSKAVAGGISLPAEIGQYRIEQCIGVGGMGIVYRGTHAKLERTVAVKVLPKSWASDPNLVRRFSREMKAVGQLDHPNIVRAHDAFEIDGQPFLVMEFVEGIDLAEVLHRSAPLAIADACEMVRQAALGLQHAHEHGLVHRDVKPSNLMLTPDGCVKVLDLGLALFKDREDADITLSGQVMGTCDYMAPEQAGHGHEADIRADIYSLGCTLYALLCGRPPFSGPQFNTAIKKIMAHCTAPAPPVCERRGDVPAALVALLDCLLAKSPGQRPSTPANVAAALQPFCAGAALAELSREAKGGVEGTRRTEAVAPMLVPLSKTERAPNTIGGLLRRSRKYLTVAAAAMLFMLGVGLVWGVIVRIKHRDGQETVVHAVNDSEIQVDADGKTVKITVAPGMEASARAPRTTASGEPLSRMALVARPTAIPGLRSWTIDTAAHHARVNALAYSPDGKWLASAGDDGTIRFWPRGAGAARLLVGHDAHVQALAWSPDGKILASGGYDATLRFWDPQTGRMLWSSTREDGWGIGHIAWSPDGARLAADQGSRIEILDVASRKRVHLLPPQGPGWGPIEWSPDGKVLACTARSIRLWDAASGKELRSFSPLGKEEDGFNAVAWSPDGTSIHSLVAKGGKGTVLLWDANSGAVTKEFRTGEWVHSFPGQLWSRDASKVAARSEDGMKTEIWDARTGHKSLTLDHGEPFVAAWSPDQRELAIADERAGTIRVCDTHRGALLRTLEGANGSTNGSMICPVAWQADGKSLAGFQWDNEVGIWSVVSARRARVLMLERTRAYEPRAIAWSPDGTRIAFGGGRNGLSVCDAGWGKEIRKIEGHSTPVQAVAWAPNGVRLASGDSEGCLLMWDANSGKLLKKLRQGSEDTNRWIGFIAWSPDGRRLAAGGASNQLEVWDADSGQIARSVPLESTPLSAAWSPDGKTLACSRFGNPKVLLWDAVRGVPKGFLDSAIVATAMAWRPDSRSLVLADLKSIEEWDVDVPARVRVCKTFFPSFCPFPPDYPLWAAFWSWTGVRQGGFSPDAAYYASAGLDGSIHFVDTVTGHTKRVMLHISANDWLSVLPEGHWIGSPAVEKHLVYVALTDQGEQIMLTPEEFAKRYDWKNIPSKTE